MFQPQITVKAEQALANAVEFLKRTDSTKEGWSLALDQAFPANGLHAGDKMFQRAAVFA